MEGYGVRLEMGELPVVAWDWITFKTADTGGFNLKCCDDAFGVHGKDEKGMKRWSALKVPTMSVENGILGYCVGGVAGGLFFEDVVEERLYCDFSAEYPRTVMSAKFKDGTIALMNEEVENLYNHRGSVSLIVAKPGNPNRLLRPARLVRTDFCCNCNVLCNSCHCLQPAIPPGPPALALSWRDTKGCVADDTPTALWRRFMQFYRKINKGSALISLEVNADAALAGLNLRNLYNESAVATYGWSEGAGVLDLKMKLVGRLLMESGPSPGLMLTNTADEQPPASAGEESASETILSGSWSLVLGDSMMQIDCMSSQSTEGEPEESPTTEASELSTKTSPPKAAECRSGPTCALCGARFARTYEMRRHVKLVHQAVREFVCTQCNKAFAMRQHLKAHVMAVHEKKRDCQCPQCGMQFTTDAKVKRHIRCVHERERLHQCGSCGQTYFQRSDLIRHERRKHVGGKI